MYPTPMIQAVAAALYCLANPHKVEADFEIQSVEVKNGFTADAHRFLDRIGKLGLSVMFGAMSQDNAVLNLRTMATKRSMMLAFSPRFTSMLADLPMRQRIEDAFASALDAAFREPVTMEWEHLPVNAPASVDAHRRRLRRNDGNPAIGPGSDVFIEVWHHGDRTVGNFGDHATIILGAHWRDIFARDEDVSKSTVLAMLGATFGDIFDGDVHVMLTEDMNDAEFEDSGDDGFPYRLPPNGGSERA